MEAAGVAMSNISAAQLLNARQRWMPQAMQPLGLHKRGEQTGRNVAILSHRLVAKLLILLYKLDCCTQTTICRKFVHGLFGV